MRLGEELGPRPPSRTHGPLGDGQLADLQAEGHRARAAGGGLQEARAGGQPGRDAAEVSGRWDWWESEIWGSYGPPRGEVSGAWRKLHLLVPNLQHTCFSVCSLALLSHPGWDFVCPHSPHPVAVPFAPPLHKLSATPSTPPHTDTRTLTALRQTSPLVQARVLGRWPSRTFLSFHLGPRPRPRHPVSPLPQVTEKEQPRRRGVREASPAERNHTGGHG